jgi:hypothetical protein
MGPLAEKVMPGTVVLNARAEKCAQGLKKLVHVQHSMIRIIIGQSCRGLNPSKQPMCQSIVVVQASEKTRFFPRAAMGLPSKHTF